MTLLLALLFTICLITLFWAGNIKSDEVSKKRKNREYQRMYRERKKQEELRELRALKRKAIRFNGMNEKGWIIR